MKAAASPRRRPKRPIYLKDQERYRLLYGPYEPPLVKRGFLVDAVRGKVPFGRFSNALIPWPKAKRQGKGGSGGFILCGDLLRALECESAPAISYHWGVCRATVGNWRRALELEGRTAGAQRLVSLGVELARLPVSRKKIADAARGRVLSTRHKSRFLGPCGEAGKKDLKRVAPNFGGAAGFPKPPNQTRGFRRKKSCSASCPLWSWCECSGAHSKASRRAGSLWVSGRVHR